MYKNRAVDVFVKQNEIIKDCSNMFSPFQCNKATKLTATFLYSSKPNIISFKINLSINHAFLLTDLKHSKLYASLITCEKPCLMFFFKVCLFILRESESTNMHKYVPRGGA